jgi:phosphatidate cytidylyltransferase
MHAGIVLFVVTLQQGLYQYQFRQFAWTHLIVFFTVVPTSFFVPLIFEGLVWFFLPSGLIIVNDIMAYVAGTPPFPC